VKKTFKSTICIALACILLVATACRGGNGYGNGNGAETNTGTRASSNIELTSTGRYMERDISPPIDGQFITFMANDGSIVAFDTSLRARYTSTDSGQTWTQSPGLNINDADRPMWIHAATLMPDGSLLTFLMDKGIVIIDTNGNASPFPVQSIDEAIANGYHVGINMMQVLGEDRLLISYTIHGFSQQMWNPEDDNYDDNENNDENEDENDETGRRSSMVMGVNGMSDRFDQRTVLYNFSGEVVAELPFMTVAAAATSGEYFYVLEQWESLITSVNLSTGALSNRSPISLATNAPISGMMQMGTSAALAISICGNLVVMHDNSVLMIEDDNIETLLDGDAFFFGSPNAFVSNVMVLACGNIAIAVLAGAEAYLFRYEWDENAVINPERTLHIWSLENNDTVRATITELRRRYPDTYITYEIAISGDTGMTAADAIRNLNTRLLSNRGPDIIILDGTPAETYATRGMLLNMAGHVDTSAMYQNLLEGFVQDNETLYILPTQFMLPVIAGAPHAINAVNTLDDFVSRIVNGNPPTPAMNRWDIAGIAEEDRAESSFTLEELFSIMWLTNAAAIVNNNQLDSNALREFFTAMLAISDMYNLSEEDNSSMMFGAVMSSRTSTRGTIITGSLIDYISQITNMGAFSMGSMMLMNMLTNRPDAELAPFPGLVSGAWEPTTMVSISADTNVADFAITFVNTMLSLAVQGMDHGMGFPVTSVGVNTQIQEINDQLIYWGADPIEIDLNSLIAQMQTPVMLENVVTEMIWETVERLCTGRLDLEGAVQEIEQNIRNYLAERS